MKSHHASNSGKKRTRRDQLFHALRTGAIRVWTLPNSSSDFDNEKFKAQLRLIAKSKRTAQVVESLKPIHG